MDSKERTEQSLPVSNSIESDTNSEKTLIANHPDDRNVEREQSEIDPDLLDSGMYITDNQRREFDSMMQQKRQEIQDNQLQFEQWLDTLTRRRMFALSRLRKLGLQHKERLNVYGKVADYVHQVEESVKSSANASRATSGIGVLANCMDNPVSENNVNMIASNMQREGTGFVPHPSGASENNTQGPKLEPLYNAPKETPMISPLKT